MSTPNAAGHKVLFLSVSAGAGHVRAAQALHAAATAHPALREATHLDVMDFVPRGFRKVYTDLYLGLVNKHPELWAHLYRATNEADPRSFMQRSRRLVERLNTRALLKEIHAQAPDAIVCTHFLPAELLGREVGKGRIECPVWVQVTDFDLHRLWVVPNITGYFAANEEVAWRMEAAGIQASAIHVTGIPVMPAFSGALDRALCAAEAGLNPDRKTILMMGGGEGMGSLESAAAQLLALEDPFQLIVLAGKNAAVLAALKQLAARFPGRLFAQGFTHQVERLMACADFTITKPGGLTTSECLAMGIPMILNSPIPGQEERNADYLLEQGVALKAIDLTTLVFRVRKLLEQPRLLATMRERARAIGRPLAARAVMDVVFAQRKVLATHLPDGQALRSP